MNRPNLDSRGTTLVELMVAIGLFAMAIAALMAINNMAFQGQGGAMAQTATANNASMIANAFSKATASASYIDSPALGATNMSAITVWDNILPDGSGTIDNTQQAVVHYLCVDGNPGNNVYLYQGTPTPNGGLPPFNPPSQCGHTSAGLTATLIAGAVTGMTITPAFSRPANNVVKSSYTVTFANNGQPIYITQTTQTMLQGPLN